MVYLYSLRGSFCRCWKTMALLRSTLLGCSVLVSLWSGWGLRAYGQSLPDDVADSLARLDQSICLQQWGQAIGITSGLIASPNVSATERQGLLNFRRQLRGWQLKPSPAAIQASCDRTSSLFLSLEEPAPPQPQPLDWNRALATLAIREPIVMLNDGAEPTADLIPIELTTGSPDILTDGATPIDTTDGFNVVGGRVNVAQHVYSFLARMGDSPELEVEVTRTLIGSGTPQLFLFDRAGRLLVQSTPDNLQASIQNFVMPTTSVYFAVVTPPETTPILDAQGLIVDWQRSQNSRFDYTLTLTGVTPYQTLLPDSRP